MATTFLALAGIGASREAPVPRRRAAPAPEFGSSHRFVMKPS